MMGWPLPASLTDIRYFVAAYEEGSFTAAAQRENATQSGVSQHIAKLERDLAIPLFERAKGRITPTSAGIAYYARCLDVLNAYEAAGASVAALAGQLSGAVSIGLMPTMTRSALAPALARFTADHPNVSVKVMEAYSGALTREVRAGAFDFGIVPAFAGSAGLRVRPFLTTPETLVSAKSGGPTSGLPQLAPIDLAELGPLKIVLPGPDNTRRQTLTTYFTTHRVDVARTMELDAMMGTLDYVASSDWVTVLPGVMMSGGIDSARLQVNPITVPRLDLDLVSIEPSRRALSPAAAAFFAILSEETRRLNGMWGPSPVKQERKQRLKSPAP
jgi:LysR family transcriptional regulator, nitrogen assimilation regulatory protein